MRFKNQLNLGLNHPVTLCHDLSMTSINQKFLEALETTEEETIFRMINTLKTYVGTQDDRKLNDLLSRLPQAVFEARLKLRLHAEAKRLQELKRRRAMMAP